MSTIDSHSPTEEVATEALPDTPYEDDAPIPGRPLRKPLGPLTYLLCVALLAGAMFYTGVRVEKAKVPSSTSTAAPFAALRTGAPPNGGTGAASGAGGAGGFGGGGGGGGTTGTVKLVDGTTVYVQQADGTIVSVSTTSGSKITVSAAGTVGQLHPGDTVSVAGSSGPNGAISATSITDSGASGTNPISSTNSSPSSSSPSAGTGGGPSG